MNRPHFEGWHLIGAFPDGKPDDVGSWLLVHGGEAMLLEVPPGFIPAHVGQALVDARADLRFVTASHDHEDNLDVDGWAALQKVFPDAEFIHPPSRTKGERQLLLGGEPIWLIGAPKHSATDVVTVFRGVAMTGDIELGTLDSVNDEVPPRIKKSSMAWLREFSERTGYHVHSIVSARLNDVRQGINWPDLFTV
jgi:hypothetical protein